MAKVYFIPGWDESFEWNESRKLQNCKFVGMPNVTSGRTYGRVATGEGGAANLGIWLIICELSSSMCDFRGVLIKNGEPFDACDIAAFGKLTEKEVQRGIDLLISKKIGWLAQTEIEDLSDQGVVDHFHRNIPNTITVPPSKKRLIQSGKRQSPTNLPPISHQSPTNLPPISHQSPEEASHESPDEGRKERRKEGKKDSPSGDGGTTDSPDSGPAQKPVKSKRKAAQRELAYSDYPGFVEWWKHYPCKESKYQTLEAWVAGGHEKGSDLMVRIIRYQITLPRWKQLIKDQHVKYGVTYLNNRGHHDVDQSKIGKTGHVPSAERKEFQQA